MYNCPAASERTHVFEPLGTFGCRGRLKSIPCKTHSAQRCSMVAWINLSQARDLIAKGVSNSKSLSRFDTCSLLMFYASLLDQPVGPPATVAFCSGTERGDSFSEVWPTCLHPGL